MTIRRPVAYRFPSFFYCLIGVIQSLKFLLSDLFAAAMPVAGNPSKCNAEDVAKTPFFTVMGTDDAITDIDIVAEFVDKVKSFGGDCMFETETSRTHEATCKQSYTKNRLNWVFSH